MIRKDYGNNKFNKNTEIESLFAQQQWMTKIGELDPTHRKFFRYLTVVLDNDQDKISFFVDAIESYYPMLQEKFKLPLSISPVIIKKEVISFIMESYVPGLSIDNSTLHVRFEAFINEKEKAIQKREPKKRAQKRKSEERFIYIKGVRIDTKQFDSKTDLQFAIKLIEKTTIGDNNENSTSRPTSAKE